MKNANTRDELEEIKTQVLHYLSQLPPVRGAVLEADWVVTIHFHWG